MLIVCLFFLAEKESQWNMKHTMCMQPPTHQKATLNRLSGRRSWELKKGVVTWKISAQAIFPRFANSYQHSFHTNTKAMCCLWWCETNIMQWLIYQFLPFFFVSNSQRTCLRVLLSGAGGCTTCMRKYFPYFMSFLFQPGEKKGAEVLIFSWKQPGWMLLVIFYKFLTHWYNQNSNSRVT